MLYVLYYVLHIAVVKKGVFICVWLYVCSPTHRESMSYVLFYCAHPAFCPILIYKRERESPKALSNSLGNSIIDSYSHRNKLFHLD